MSDRYANARLALERVGQAYIEAACQRPYDLKRIRNLAAEFHRAERELQLSAA